MKGNDAFWKVLNSLMVDGDENKALALVGLNKGVVTSCVQDPATMAIVDAHMEQAKALKVEGTPYIVIKGPKSSKKIPGMPDQAQLESVIANMLIE
jgi:protein-disulfide isomerase